MWPVVCSQAAPGGAVVVCRSPELQNRAHAMWVLTDMRCAVLYHSVG